MVAGRPQTSFLTSHKKRNSRKRNFFVTALVAALLMTLAEARSQTLPSGEPLAQRTSMVVGAPTVDGNGVKSFQVTSVYQGRHPTTVRVLEPTKPAAGKARRILYVLPVEAGATRLTSALGDGFDELRIMDVPNLYNVTLIAPSFHIAPWYGDHDTDPDTRLESFIVNDLVPFGDSFGTPGQIPQRWLVGFSKSGNGALSLLFRHPDIFDAAAVWDAPVQLTDITRFPSVQGNFGSKENFARYFIPSLLKKNAEIFQTRNRIWISGDESDWTSDMTRLHEQFVEAGIEHTWAQRGKRRHGWFSGWLDAAIEALDANAGSGNMLDARQITSYSGRQPTHFIDSERNEKTEIGTPNARRNMAIYRASVDFSSVQGFRNWYYIYGSGNPMTFSEGKWRGNEKYLELDANGGHPGDLSDAIRRWKAPQAGTLTISGTAFDQNPGCGAGSTVYVRKNSVTLWQRTIANGNSKGIPLNVTTTVVAGDNIDFGINRGPDDMSSCDSTGLDPTIEFTFK
jgi:hypothetical protein